LTSNCSDPARVSLGSLSGPDFSKCLEKKIGIYEWSREKRTMEILLYSTLCTLFISSARQIFTTWRKLRLVSNSAIAAGSNSAGNKAS